MKKSLNSVTINAVTYKALLQQFSTANGVDITPILNDLSTRQGAALNCALLMRGAKFEMPFNVVYSTDWRGEQIYEDKAIETSYILNEVTIKRTCAKFETSEDGERKLSEFKDYDTYTRSLDDFLNGNPSLTEITAEANKNFADRKK